LPDVPTPIDSRTTVMVGRQGPERQVSVMFSGKGGSTVEAVSPRLSTVCAEATPVVKKRLRKSAKHERTPANPNLVMHVNMFVSFSEGCRRFYNAFTEGVPTLLLYTYAASTAKTTQVRIFLVRDLRVYDISPVEPQYACFI
jgi:hypothetical protein